MHGNKRNERNEMYRKRLDDEVNNFDGFIMSTVAGNIGPAVFNWYSNNVQALTSKMYVLQLDQLSEQILFLFDCVWCTLQSNDTNFRARFELQLN